MHALLGLITATLTGVEPNFDAYALSYRTVDYEVPFHGDIKLETSHDFLPKIFFVDDGRAFCIDSGAEDKLFTNARSEAPSPVPANLPHRVKDLAYYKDLYLLTDEAHPRIMSSSDACQHFEEASEIETTLYDNETVLMFGRGTTLALVTDRRVLAGSDVCEFGQNSGDPGMAGSCGYIVQNGDSPQHTSISLHEVALPKGISTTDIAKIEANEILVIHLNNGSVYATGKDRGQYCTDEPDDGLIHKLPDSVTHYWQETVITGWTDSAMNNVGYALINKKLFVCQDYDIREPTQKELEERFGTKLNEFSYIHGNTYVQRGKVFFAGPGGDSRLQMQLPSPGEYIMLQEYILRRDQTQ